MNFCRRQLKNNFTIIDNEIFKNSKLSLKAKGLLCTMLSFSGRWELSIAGLAKFCNCGKEQIRNSIDEIIAAGFLVRGAERRDEKGRFNGCEWVLYDEPQLTEHRVGKTDAEKPTRVNRCGLTDAGKPPQTKNKEQKQTTKYQSLNNNNKDVVVKKMVDYGVAEDIAQELAEEFTAERIDEVVAAAQSKDNPAGWIVSALRKKWEIMHSLRQGEVRRKAAKPDCCLCKGTGIARYYAGSEPIERPCPCTEVA